LVGRHLQYNVAEQSKVKQSKFFAHHELREGQDEMLEDCINALEKNGHHLAAAPTGIGKTAASLAAALEILSLSDNKKIFFLTGRQSQHRIVIETIKEINASLDFKNVKCVDLIGRQSMCIELDSYSGKCNCEGGISKGKETKYEIFCEEILEKPLHVNEVITKSQSKLLCPYKALRNCAKDADVVVCDYNHLFIKNVRESSLPGLGVSLEDIILVVDEAHNLPNRIRKGLERTLTKQTVTHCKYEVEEYMGYLQSKSEEALWELIFKSLENLEKNLLKYFVKWKDNIGNNTKEKRIYSNELMKIFLDSMLPNEIYNSNEDALLHFSKMLNKVVVDNDGKELSCWRIAALIDTLIDFEDKKELVIVYNDEKAGKISCHLLDPSIISKPIFSKSAGSILMSGTLYPPTMYSDILGLNTLKNVSHNEYTSPFESHNKPISVATNVTTQYRQRGPENTRKICEHIYSVAKETPGHIAVFAPSYKLLDEFVDNEGWPNRLVIKEKSDWKKSEIDQIIPDLEKYRHSKQKILLAGVFGGKLSEGIDYQNNILDAVVCIGIPVPPPSVFSDALRGFLDNKFGKNKGWLYASTQPAINSVIQAMGRPIRSSKDRAFIILLDSRHLDLSYRKCHALNFNPLICNDSESTRRYIERFFTRKQRS